VETSTYAVKPAVPEVVDVLVTVDVVTDELDPEVLEQVSGGSFNLT
jgi:hypothetical protein